MTAWHSDLETPLKALCEMSYLITKDYFLKNPTASVFDFRTFIYNLNIQELRKMSFMPCYSRQDLTDAQKALVTDKACKENFGTYYQASDSAWCSQFKAKDSATLTDNLIELIKNRIQIHSVLGVSGPKATMHALEDYIPEKMDVTSSDYKEFIGKVSDCSVMGNNLSMYIGKKQGVIPTNPLKQIGSLSDLSWSALGAKNQLQRNTLFAQKASMIQQAFRKYQVRKGTM